LKRALVTGSDGFIGSHLVELLVKEGYSVRAFCMYNSFGSWGWLDTLSDDIKSNIQVVLGDVRDPESVKSAMKGCDVVFHLAALIAIPYSYQAPQSYIQTNIQGTLNVVSAARDLDIPKIVHTSTSEVYGTAKFIPISEEHPLSPQSPYSASKIGADQIALSFWHTFQTPISILRPFNTYGPRQSTRAVIPTIITQLLSGERRINIGSTKPTRDFNFVEDTCRAFIEVSRSKEANGKILNSASNFEISVLDTIKLIAGILDVQVDISHDEKRMRPESSEVFRLYGDNSLIKELTNWEPLYSGIDGFKRGLKITIEWFSDPKNLSKYRAGEFTI